MNEFYQYIYSNFSTKNDDEITHTRIGDKALGIYGGKYSVPDEKYEEFMEMYFNWVFVAGNDEYMTEKQLEKGPIYIDLDFRYDTSITSRQHTKDHNIDIVMRYMDCVKELIDIDNTPIDVYVMEKDEVNCLENKTKDGIHILINLNMEVELRIELRKRVILNNLEDILNLPLTNDFQDVLDEGITKCFVNTQMIGSKKPAHQPYKIVQHLIVKLEGEYFEYEDKTKSFKLQEHLFNLSTRYADRPYFAAKEGELEKAKQNHNPQSTKKTEIKKEEFSLNPSDSHIKIYCELGIKHNIWEKVWKGTPSTQSYIMWRNAGFLIKNEVGDKGEDLFVDISRKYDSFDEDDVRNFYKQLNKTNKNDNKKPLTVGSLVKYFKDSDKDLAKIIIKEAVLLIKKQQPKELKEESNIKLDENKLDHFDSEYMNSFKDDYLTQKKYFEHFVCKVLLPEPQFIYIEGAKDFGKKAYIFTESYINTAFKHIKTEELKGKGENTYIVEVSFVLLWLNDTNQRVYNKLEFEPMNDVNVGEQKDKRIFNLFAGYNTKIKSEYVKENQQKILKPFIDLGRELCGGVQKDLEYFIKFIAQMIQKPNEKIPVAFIFKGKQGTGKSMFINAIGNLLGQEHYISSSNPKDFFGDYAEGFYHKLLVNMNECEGKDTFDFEGKIKSFISEDRITINPKNVRPTEINNLARVIISTNKANPIPIDVKTGDRRYVVYQSTDFFLDKKYGSIFWQKLLTHFKRPEFIACLYDYLNGLDISKVDWRSERPITDAYKQMCKLYVPIEALFFEDYINAHRGCMLDISGNTINGANWTIQQEPRSKEVYDEYVKFCKSNGFSNDKRFVASIPNFNNRCIELEIPHLVIKSSGNNEFRYTPKDIYDHLLKKKWINREIDDPEIVIIDEKGEDVDFEI